MIGGAFDTIDSLSELGGLAGLGSLIEGAVQKTITGPASDSPAQVINGQVNTYLGGPTAYSVVPNNPLSSLPLSGGGSVLPSDSSGQSFINSVLGDLSQGLAPGSSMIAGQPFINSAISDLSKGLAPGSSMIAQAITTSTPADLSWVIYLVLVVLLIAAVVALIAPDGSAQTVINLSKATLA